MAVSEEKLRRKILEITGAIKSTIGDEIPGFGLDASTNEALSELLTEKFKTLETSADLRAISDDYGRMLAEKEALATKESEIAKERASLEARATELVESVRTQIAEAQERAAKELEIEREKDSVELERRLKAAAEQERIATERERKAAEKESSVDARVAKIQAELEAASKEAERLRNEVVAKLRSELEQQRREAERLKAEVVAQLEAEKSALVVELDSSRSENRLITAEATKLKASVETFKLEATAQKALVEARDRELEELRREKAVLIGRVEAERQAAEDARRQLGGMRDWAAQVNAAIDSKPVIARSINKFTF